VAKPLEGRIVVCTSEMDVAVALAAAGASVVIAESDAGVVGARTAALAASGTRVTGYVVDATDDTSTSVAEAIAELLG
jgi:hypothetical protein